jgi:hypothetical protein
VLPKAVDDASTRVFGMAYNLDSSLLAVHIMIDAREQVMIFTRSNWKWYCKQAMAVKGLNTMVWYKKYMLCLVNDDGHVDFVEYNFTYHVSNAHSNHASTKDSSYVAVVDGCTIHLTPLGKFLMPPPMSEKQVTLPVVANCLSLYGHWAVAYSDMDQCFFSFDCDAG